MNNKINWKTRGKKYNRSSNWYWTFWTLSTFLIFITSYFYKDYIFSALILSIAILITLSNLKKRSITECQINDEFILNSIEKEKAYYKNIEYYNIDKNNHVILFKQKNKNFFPYTLPFEPSQNMQKVDDFLQKKLEKKEEFTYPFSLVIINYFLGI